MSTFFTSYFQHIPNLTLLITSTATSLYWPVDLSWVDLCNWLLTGCLPSKFSSLHSVCLKAARIYILKLSFKFFHYSLYSLYLEALKVLLDPDSALLSRTPPRWCSVFPTASWQLASACSCSRDAKTNQWIRVGRDSSLHQDIFHPPFTLESSAMDNHHLNERFCDRMQGGDSLFLSFLPQLLSGIPL